MTNELVGPLGMGLMALALGRQILQKKEIKVPKWIDYPVTFSGVLLTAYIIHDTFYLYLFG